MRNMLGVGAIMKPIRSSESSVATSVVQLVSECCEADCGTDARNWDSGAQSCARRSLTLTSHGSVSRQ
jgi:hypothetical protein